jgi:hypothetical protein
MKIRASFLTFIAGAVLAISAGVSTHSVASADTQSGVKITQSHLFTVTANDGDGNDPWPKPGP